MCVKGVERGVDTVTNVTKRVYSMDHIIMKFTSVREYCIIDVRSICIVHSIKH